MVVNVYTTSSTSDKSSRHELLAFVNSSLHANLTRIEELSTGAAYCQLTDLLFRGSIPLKKVKWNARTDVDCLHNWRLLQFAWKELGINKMIPVERLVYARFQDNFEFLQWFKKFFDANYDRSPYDALAARNGEMLPPGSSSKTKFAMKTSKSQNQIETASVVGKHKPLQPAKISQVKAPNARTSKDSAPEIDDLTDFQIRMLQDRCKRLEGNLNDMKKQRDSYAAIVHAINEYCENSETPFSREAILSIVRIRLSHLQK